MLNLNYGNDAIPYSGRLAIQMKGWKDKYEEFGIYNTSSSFFNLPTIEYRFDINIMFYPINSEGKINVSRISKYFMLL